MKTKPIRNANFGRFLHVFIVFLDFSLPEFLPRSLKRSTAKLLSQSAIYSEQPQLHWTSTLSPAKATKITTTELEEEQEEEEEGVEWSGELNCEIKATGFFNGIYCV